MAITATIWMEVAFSEKFAGWKLYTGFHTNLTEQVTNNNNPHSSVRHKYMYVYVCVCIYIGLQNMYISGLMIKL